jgi:hypothetical protein
MKRLRLLPVLLLAATGAAQPSFPGLQTLLSEAEWKRAGLDRLTPDEIGVIDAALIRHHRQAAAAAATPPPVAPAPGESPAQNAVARARFWEKFGFGKAGASDWRNQPPMAARVTSLPGPNRFVLDTGQVWEGQDPIPFELLGREVIIEARPLGAFAMKLAGDALYVRVHRVK